MSMDTFNQVSQILFAVVTVIGGLFGFYYIRSTNDPTSVMRADVIDLRFLFLSILTIAGCIAPFFYWFSFFISFYWLIFFKLQSTLFLTLPYSTSQILSFELVLIIALLGEVHVEFTFSCLISSAKSYDNVKSKCFLSIGKSLKGNYNLLILLRP